MADDCYIGNGTKPNAMAGDPVQVGFSSTVSASSTFPMVITDANGQVRTLLPTERLVLHALVGDVSAGHAEVCNGSTLASSTLIASFGANNGQWMSDNGYSLPIGVTPFVISNGSSSTATINISGTGAIQEGTTQGVRPKWREATVRGD